MSKDYGPKTNVEQHHHIEDLIEGQKKRTEDRHYHQERIKKAEEREKDMREAKLLQVVDFHCRHCRVDFTSTAMAQVEIDWSNPTQRIAFYKMKHKECGNWCIRHITDKWKDAFWSLSRKVNNDRSKFHNDLIQPYEEGFNLLYGKPR